MSRSRNPVPRRGGGPDRGRAPVGNVSIHCVGGTGRTWRRQNITAAPLCSYARPCVTARTIGQIQGRRTPKATNKGPIKGPISEPDSLLECVEMCT